jgi:hypothetical protein
MAREEALIISEGLFTALSPISGNMDWEYIWPQILAAQDKYIQPTLGQKLYEKIMEDIKAATLADPYKLLLEDYIARTCVWYTCYQGMQFWSIKIVNSGIVQMIADDSTAIDVNDIDKIARKCKEQGEFYKQRLIDYLCANSSQYPEYTTNTSEQVHPEKTNYSSGLNLESYTKKTNKSNDWYL